MSEDADNDSILPADCPLEGHLTVWAESIDSKGYRIGDDDDAFDKSVNSGRCLDADSTMVVRAIGWNDADSHLSARAGHSTDNYRCRAIRVSYPIGVRLSGEVTDDFGRALAGDIAAFSNWRLKGFHPVGFTVRLKHRDGRVFDGGVHGPVASELGGAFK